MGLNKKIRRLFALLLALVLVTSVDGLGVLTFAEEVEGAPVGVQNGSFEDWTWGPRVLTGWEVDAATDAVMSDKWTADGPQDGVTFIQFWSNSAYQAEIYQDVTGLEPGNYYLQAYTQSSGGQNGCYLYANGTEQSPLTKTVTASTGWQKIVVKGIVVAEDGKAQIGLSMDANAGDWLSLDNVTLVKEQEVPEAPDNIPNGSFEEWSGEPEKPDGWEIDETTAAADAVMSKKTSNVQHEANAISFWSAEDYKVNLYQEVTDLEPGYYYLSGYTQNGGGQNSGYLYASGTAQSVSQTMIPRSDYWRQTVVRGIKVEEDGIARIGLYTDANAGNWISLDNLTLVKEKNQDQPYKLLKGGDISELTYVEDEGGIYRDADGNAGDALQILRETGFEFARLRLYNSPGKGKGDGLYYCKEGYEDEADILTLAKRAANKGMEIELSFHYGDYWTNGVTNIIPADWQPEIAGMNDSDAVNKLCELIYDYTYDFMEKMKAQGTVPAYVSLGNEIQGGILFPYGKNAVDTWPNLARFLNSGSKAVKDSSPDSQVIIHLDDAGNDDKYTKFFDNCDTYEVNYDVIGPSYYPFWTDKNVDKIVDFCDMLIERYQRNIMIMETGFNYSATLPNGNPGQLTDNGDDYIGIYDSTPEGQKYFMAEVFNGLKTIGLGTEYSCLGDLYWDPIMIEQEGVGWAMIEATDEPDINAVSNTTLFDFDHKLLPVKDVYAYNSEGTDVGSISGKIVSNGNPNLGIGNMEAEFILGDGTHNIKTDRYGTFYLNNIPAGTYDVALTVSGMNSALEADMNVTVEKGSTARLTLPVTGVTIAGNVTDNNNTPLANVTIWAKQGNVEYSAATDAAGNYSLVDIPAGDYEITAVKIGYHSSEAQNVQMGIGETVSDKDFQLTLTSGSVNGKVVTSANGAEEPISEATITAELNGVKTTVQTDANGDYMLEYLEAGETYTIRVKKKGYLEETFDITVVLGETTTADKVTLTADIGSIRGIVKDANGNVIVGANVLVKDKSIAEEVQYNVTTDAAGGFEIEKAISGDYTISAVKNGYMNSAKRSITVSFADETDVNTIILATPVTIINMGFEDGSTTDIPAGWDDWKAPAGWKVSGTVSAVNGPAIARQDRTPFQGTVEGTFALSMWMDTAFTAEASQTITNLAPGTYLLRAQTYSGINKDFYMYAKDSSGNVIGKTDISLSGSFKDTILEFTTTETQCTIGFYADAGGGDWAVVDAVELGALAYIPVYSINYVLNDSVAKPAQNSNPASYVKGTAVTLTNPARNGYTFGGWYTDAAFRNKVTSITAAETGVKTFYAKWTEIKYNIKYELNGGTNHKQNPATFANGTALTLYAPTKKGFVFDGWYLNNKFTGNKVTTIGNSETQNITLYAKWTKTEIQFKNSTLTLAPNKTTTNLKNITGKTGTVSWTTSNKKIATVDANGKVKAIAAGKAKITVKVNDVSKSFYVKVTPKQVTSLKAVKKGSTGAKLSWKKIKDASGYQFEMKTGSKGSYKVVKTLSSAGKITYTQSKLKKGTTYTFRVRAYKTIDGKKVFGNYSTVKKYTVKK